MGVELIEVQLREQLSSLHDEKERAKLTPESPLTSLTAPHKPQSGIAMLGPRQALALDVASVRASSFCKRMRIRSMKLIIGSKPPLVPVEQSVEILSKNVSV